MVRSVCVLVLLTACAEDPAGRHDFEGIEVAASPPPAGAEVLTARVGFAYPGSVTRIEVEGAPPGAKIWYAFSRQISAGAGPCVPGTTTCGDLMGIYLTDSAVADDWGYANDELAVPNQVSITGAWFQAVADTGLRVWMSEPAWVPIVAQDCQNYGWYLDLWQAHGRLTGSFPAARFGASILVEDLNGDGYDDLIVAAPDAYPDKSGAVAVDYGPIPVNADRRMRAEALFTGPISGVPNAFGEQMAVGDFNGDGLTDLVIGAPGNHDAYVFLGPSSATRAAEDADAILRGAWGSDFGQAVAVADFDGDGDDEIVVGAPRASNGGQGSGSVFVFDDPSGTVGAGSATVVLDGSSPNLGIGTAVAGNIDLDRDGFPDLVVGAPREDSDNGAVYAFLNPLAASVTTSSAADARVIGTAHAQLGAFVTGAGDTDGDGFRELAVTELLREGAGVVFNWTGDQVLSGVPPLGVWSGDTIVGGGHHVGHDIAVGDFNGDELDDVLVAALDSPTSIWPGRGFLVNGKTRGWGVVTSTEVAHGFKNTVSGEQTAIGVALGDIDGDGQDDVLIGSGSRGSDGEISIFRGCH